jgi:Putative adhesin/Domain of unknown function (DUF5668)
VTNGQPTQRTSIFPGLLCILLGILFLLARFNPDFRLWHYIWRFSPLLLILWGVAKLIDNFAAQHTGEDRPPLLTGAEAALLILILFVLAGMTFVSRFHERHPDMSFDIDMFNQDASAMQELPSTKIPPASHVTISTDRGDVDVHASDGNDLQVSANKSAHGASEHAAQERINLVDVRVEKTADGYTIHPTDQEGAHGNVKVDLEVTVPASAVLSVNSGHGDIKIAGVNGAVTAVSQEGTVEVHDSGSDVTATITKGNARIMNAAGSVHLNGRGSEVEISGVKGDASVAGEFYGPIRVRNVAKTTHYTSQKADIQLVKLTGLLELDSGSIEVSDVGGAAKLATQEKDIEVENVAGKLQVSDKNGGIKVGYSEPPREEISIANSSGAVELTLSSKSAFEINAVSTNGEVDSDFDNATLDSSNDNGSGKIVGRVGTGGPKITIVTSYGPINLRKAS